MCFTLIDVGAFHTPRFYYPLTAVSSYLGMEFPSGRGLVQVGYVMLRDSFGILF